MTREEKRDLRKKVIAAVLAAAPNMPWTKTVFSGYIAVMSHCIYVPRTRWADNQKRFGGPMTTGDMLPAMVTVPFIWNYYDRKINMDIVGGQIGITVDESMTVRPALAWAVRQKYEKKGEA